MLVKALGKFLLVSVMFCLPVLISGCSDKKTPTGPEMGALDKYLEEHPEEADVADEEMDDTDELDDGEG